MQGIYHYKGNDFDIFSNGFIILIEYLKKNNIKLSFNKDFGAQYIFCNEVPINPNDTLINEILRLNKDIKITIYKNGKVLFTEIDYEVNTIKIDTKEAIDIIDKWHEKWCKAFRYIAKYYSPFRMDLSGGFDSRICFGLILNSNIDKNNFSIRRNISSKSGYIKSDMDFKISELILKKYGCEGRSNFEFFQTIEGNFDELLKECYDISNLIFGNSKTCKYNLDIFNIPIVHINGVYGDRCHYGDLKPSYTKIQQNNFKKDIQENDLKIVSDLIENNYKKIVNKYQTKNRQMNKGDFNNEYQSRFFGDKITLKNFNNEIFITPFSDPLIHKILYTEGVNNSYKLYYLIYTRYFKDLLNFEFENVSQLRIITEDDKIFANKMCEKYPFNKVEYERINYITKENKVMCINVNQKELKEHLFNILKKGEEKFKSIYCEEYFELALNDFKKDNICVQNYFTPIVGICNILNLLG